LDYLHQHKIIHGDIKLGNLLLTENMDLKLADFGLAAKLAYEGERKRTVCGTPNYIAPEVLEGNHSYEADVWSLGVLIYTLLVGYPPFQTNNINSTYKRIRSSIYVFPDHVPLSETAKDLIAKILVCDPIKRINLNEIFSHDFFNRNELPVHVPLSTLAVPPSSEIFEKPIDLDEMSTSSSEELKPIEKVFVEKWEKIGKHLIYYLNSTFVGVVFEDGSLMIRNFEEFFYIEKKKIKYNYFNYCESIKLKVSLLKYAIQHFHAFYKEPLDKSVYIKRWVVKEHATVFKIGNSTLQVYFTDNSQLILMKSLNELIYISKAAIKSRHSFSNLNEIKNRDLVTRIRFTHSVMIKRQKIPD
jgi:serine/threonine protein kinase